MHVSRGGGRSHPLKIWTFAWARCPCYVVYGLVCRNIRPLIRVLLFLFLFLTPVRAPAQQQAPKDVFAQAVELHRSAVGPKATREDAFNDLARRASAAREADRIAAAIDLYRQALQMLPSCHE